MTEIRLTPKDVTIMATLNDPPKWWVHIGCFPYWLLAELYDTKLEAQHRARQLKKWLKETEVKDE